MTALQKILAAYRDTALTEREKGTYFEKLIICYFKNEASYKDLYSNVWLYSDWAKEQGLDARDTGIDLVAQTAGTGEFHAIQCKLYAEDHRLQKKDIDSFFTASGKKPFTHRIIVCTTNDWSEHAEDALRDQQPPVSKIDLHDLENSQIDWALYTPDAAPALKPKKALRPHQIKAVNAVTDQLALAERGKLIMACGTGKTFTSLKIAEAMAGRGGRVLFLVPSLSLLSQTLTEWTQESAVPLHSFAVCSDSDVGKKRKKDDDIVQTFTHELRYPATTNAARLAEEIARRHDAAHMSVVFATYHSIKVVSDAQNSFGLPPFDIVICDEAHRTTGVTFGDDESHFVQVHDAAFIHSAKRLYMTATPRIYADSAKAVAEKENAALCSMDDPALFGETLHTITFSEAVAQGLLVDYKVIVLAIEESHVNRRLQELLKNEDNQIKVDDAARIVGCWKALSKQGLTLDGLEEDPAAMRRAVAFCQVIETQHKGRTHKVSSKNIASMFQAVVQSYQQTADDEEKEQFPEAFALTCEAEHVDGGMNASQKEEKLNWLKEETPADTCRVLSNVRCLSEGVDVPALDAVLFLSPRNSQVDVVQSVGRVMRNASGKKRGYVVLPVVIPAGMEPHEALDNNNTYRVVWQVLQALRSHDDRFDAFINKIDLIGAEPRKMEVIAVCDKLPTQRASKETGGNMGSGSFTLGETATSGQRQAPMQLTFEMGEIERAIYAKVVKKCGNRNHWEEWASDIAKIARTHIDRIAAILESPENTAERKAFNAFANELRDDLNDSLSDAEIIEMLAQHLITRPVFDALFSDYSFASQNPMSQAMQKVLDILHQHHLEKETDTLQKFYDSVKMRAEGVDNAQGRQKIVVELYDKFFRNAFPRMTEKLGIVYTPVEVVDFIIHSVNDILQQEFGQTLGSDGVHILDPFTGTGTFITRLLQSGLMTPEQIRKKYKDQIHANEIVLLAYYIAAINIESTYHSLVGGPYVPFEGICLTDTFQMYEKEDLIDLILVDNSARRKRQKKLDIRVIVGNPPYSIGQTSANDNNQNVAYPTLDESIRRTYAAHSTATLKNSLYDSYIRAIRWASDRIGNRGVIGFVSGSGFVEKPAMDGMRKCLTKEFSNIHVINLRGDIRKNMLSKGRAGEGGNIFDSGSMTGIAITLFVKNPKAKQHGKIFYHDIGSNLSSEEKKRALQDYVNITGITAANGWQSITPDEHGDWLQQRDNSFSQFRVIGDKKRNSQNLFDNFSNGVKTNRDAWVYNFSRNKLISNVSRMIEYYNSELERYILICAGTPEKSWPAIDNFVVFDSTKFSWTREVKNDLRKHKKRNLILNGFVPSLYRPFTRSFMYFNRHFNNCVYQMPRIFPEASVDNRVICVSGIGARSGFSAFMADNIPCLDMVEKGQCFPLYLYDDPSEIKAPSQSQGSLFDTPAPEPKQLTRRDAITDEGLKHFQRAYAGEKISKEDLFYYIYGLLHSEQYREWYADNLAKELPRIPRVKLAADFWAFSKAGRELAKLHIGYESVEPYPATVSIAGGKTLDDCTPQDFRVEKMRYGKNGKEKDLTTLHYNSKITVTGIPPEAYEYVVNGKPALDWVVERQCVKTDKDSGIVNDANDWAIETMHNPRYPLELFLRVITVSLETLKIVKALPKLEKEELS